jgi:uncharacterized protein YcfL
MMDSLQYVLAFALGSLLLVGCDALQVDDRTFSGDPKIEFSPVSETVDEGEGTVTTKVQLIGPQRDSDLSVSFTVADSSTATAGEEYTLGATSGTISANSSQTEFDIQVLDNNRDDGDTDYVLYLNLQDSQGVEAAENLKTYTLIIRGTDEDDE